MAAPKDLGHKMPGFEVMEETEKPDRSMLKSPAPNVNVLSTQSAARGFLTRRICTPRIGLGENQKERHQ
jgi:hypothetical protein